MSIITGNGPMRYGDSNGVSYPFITNAGSPQVCAQDYLHAIAEGDISNHTPLFKIAIPPQ